MGQLARSTEDMRRLIEVEQKISSSLDPEEVVTAAVESAVEVVGAGEEIPLLARIICVADAYDAMTTARPYRGAHPGELASRGGLIYDYPPSGGTFRDYRPFAGVIVRKKELPGFVGTTYHRLPVIQAGHSFPSSGSREPTPEVKEMVEELVAVLNKQWPFEMP